MMPTIIKADLPHVFSAFATEYSKEEFMVHRKTYFCNYCSQMFTVRWNIRANPSTPQYCRGKFVFCPHCQHRHEKQICYTDKNLAIPYEIGLNLKVCKEKVTLQATYKSIYFKDKEFNYGAYKCKELFSFDVMKSHSTFQKFIWDEKKVNYTSSEITTDTAQEIIKHSALYYLNHESFAFKDSSIKKIFRTLQLELQKRLFEKHRKKIHSLRINTGGLPDGALLTVLLNFARRVKNIDAPNFTVKTPFPQSAPFIFFEFPIDFSESIVCKAAQSLLSGKDDITAVINAFSFRNTFCIRKIIKANPVNAIILKEILSVFDNYDFVIRAYYAYTNNDDISYRGIKRFILSLEKLQFWFNEKSLVKLLEDKKSTYQAGDVLSLVSKLNPIYLNRLHEKKIRIRDLHKFLVEQYNFQEQTHASRQRPARHTLYNYKELLAAHINKKSDISESNIEQLALNVDNFHFELPKEAMDLLNAGQALGNCIGTYDYKIKKGHCIVVLVSDESNKIKASLEIQNSKIVQAEISHHRPPSADPAINQAIVNWSKQTGLSINTTAISIAA